MIRFVLSALLLVAALPAAAFKLTVYHTNDVHGWIMPRVSTYEKDAGKLVGGAAVLKNVIKADPGPKLVLDGGDWFQGTPEGNVPEGQSLVDVFNAVGFDGVVVGNHDFDLKESRLKELVSGLKMPALGANVYRRKDHKRVDYLTPWFVKELGGVKVGVFGLLTTNMHNLTFPENYDGLEFRREIDEAKDAVKALKKQGATVIIAVTHMGYEGKDMGRFEGDQTLANKVPGIDLIVGGHTHTFVREPKREGKHGTLVVQAGTTLSTVGKAVLEIDEKTKKVVSSSGELVDLHVDKYGEDAQVKAVVDKYAESVGKVYDVTIATSTAELRRNRDGESSLGDWMTDCLRAWAKADVAIQNAGGIRADIDKGPITLRTIFNVMPFDNRVVTLKMGGEALFTVLDHGAGKSKGMIQVSGATFGYDRDAEPGKRVWDVKIGDAPLDPKGKYTVATIDFLVKGGDGYPFSRADDAQETRALLRDVLSNCAQDQKTVAFPRMGRITAKK